MQLLNRPHSAFFQPHAAEKRRGAAAETSFDDDNPDEINTPINYARRLGAGHCHFADVISVQNLTLADEPARPFVWDKAKIAGEPYQDRDPRWVQFALWCGKLITVLLVYLAVFLGAAASLLLFQMAAAGMGSTNHTYTGAFSVAQLGVRWPCIYSVARLLAEESINASSVTPTSALSQILQLESTSINVTMHFEESNTLKWTWALCIMLFFPNVVGFLWSLNKICFSSVTRPPVAHVLFNTLVQCASAFGTAILSFGILPHPKLGAFNALLFMNALAIVPAVLSLLLTFRDSSLSNRWRFVIRGINVVAVLCQLSLFASQYCTHRYFGWDIEDGALMCGCALLISLGWWESYVSTLADRSALPHLLRRALRHYRAAEVDAYPKTILIVSVVNCVCVFVVMAVTTGIKKTWSTATFMQLFDNSAFLDHNVTIDIALVGNELSNASATCQLTEQAAWVVTTLQVLSSFLCFLGSIYACKIMNVKFAFAYPLSVSVPAVVMAAYLIRNPAHKATMEQFAILYFHLPPETLWQVNENTLQTGWSDYLGQNTAYLFYFWLAWVASTIWLTRHAWYAPAERLARLERLFVSPIYSPAFIHLSLLFGRKNVNIEDVVLNQTIHSYTHAELCNNAESQATLERGITDNATTVSIMSEEIFPKILVCCTMWHENKEEMKSLLRSVMRLDRFQSKKELIKEQFPKVFESYSKNDYFTFEAHIFFDDAFNKSNNSNEQVANSFVVDLTEVISDAAKDAYGGAFTIKDPHLYETPYGGQIVYKLLGAGKNCITVHLKNKDRIRHKKRWSQVMYMYYLLQYCLRKENETLTPGGKKRFEEILHNTHILTLDGDVDFKPEAVLRLLDLMKTSRKIGSVCGRIHPLGSGPVVWYQKFEYAVGHWLQKAAEHMFGCVLCSPGCFALFRASAVMDDNVMRMYASKSETAMNYLQQDQGEDRWLCTLLLKKGYRIEYSAAADAYTFAPVGFDEFWNQRRRWTPSTVANTIDLLSSKKTLVVNNDSMSTMYVWYEMLMMASTVLGPGAIVLMLFGSFNTVFGLELFTSMMSVLSVIIFYCVLCIVASPKIQLAFGFILSLLFALLMAAVAVALALQSRIEGITSPNTIFLILLIIIFVVAGALHPREFTCLIWGVLYFVAIPSTYLLMQIYSVSQVDNVSWGTREVKPATEPSSVQQSAPTASGDMVQRAKGLFSKLPISNASGAFIMRCMNCCTCTIGAAPEAPTSQLDEIRLTVKSLDATVGHLVQCLRDDGDQIGRAARPGSSISTSVAKRTNARPKIQSSEGTNNSKADASTKLNEIVFSSETCEQLPDDDRQFWQQLIELYLTPLEDNKERQAVVKKDLRSLRNKAALAMYLANGFFILVVFIMQMQQGCLSFDWPLSDVRNTTRFICVDGKTVQTEGVGRLQLAPVTFVVLLFFLSLLLMQFVGMLLHRLETWTHLMAATPLRLMDFLHWLLRRQDSGDDFGVSNQMEATEGFARDLEMLIDRMQTHKVSGKRRGTMSTWTSGNSNDRTMTDMWHKNARRMRRQIERQQTDRSARVPHADSIYISQYLAQNRRPQTGTGWPMHNTRNF